MGMFRKNKRGFDGFDGEDDQREFEERLDDDAFDDRGEEEYAEPDFMQGRSKVINMADSRKSMDQTTQMNMVIFRPTEYDQAQTIIDYLKIRKPIIVNLDEIEVAVAQRILDFITGAVYALSGDIKKAARNIFVVVPSNVGVSNAEEEDVNENGYGTDEEY